MAFSTLGGILALIGGLIVGVIVLGLLIYYSIRIVRLLIKLVGHVVMTIARWVGDIFRLIGAIVVAIVFIPLIVLNIVIGRWSASAHFGRAFTDEIKTAGACLYRIAIGHPLHLIGLRSLTEGIEQRLPLAVAGAPGADRPSKKRQGLFEGYTIVGSLQGGGSGGKLYVAEPDDIKRAAYARRGHTDVDRVVIKTFSLEDGSSLPQIVRESRALDAAKKLGLVLEHDLSAERFFYIMKYVPGDSLTVATQQLHARSEASGLNSAGIRLAVGYTADLLEALDVYHRGGLWHKDVKPDNLIVDREPDPALGRGRAHLVDFGLITPLRSAMTLTTHGTEYFRDPELVRQALRGVKVHQIDGGKFDVYATGAVLFSIVENSFPAHGGLSQVSKKCPESLRWIIRRAMTDYDKRYPTARAMLEDLTVVAAAADPYTVKPADLPSVSGQPKIDIPQAPASPAGFDAPIHASASPVPPKAPSPMHAAIPAAAPAAAIAGMPKLRVSDWWTGRYTPETPKGAKAPAPNEPEGFVFNADIGKGTPGARPLTPADARLSAKEQLKNAQRRAADRRALVGKRRNRRNRRNDAKLAALGPTARAGRRPRSKPPSAINTGVMTAVAFVVAAGISAILVTAFQSGRNTTTSSTTVYTDESGNTRIVTEGDFYLPDMPPTPTMPDIKGISEMAEMKAMQAMETMPEMGRYPANTGVQGSTNNIYHDIVPAPGTVDGDLDIALLTTFSPPFDAKFKAGLSSTQAILDGAGAYTATTLFDDHIDHWQKDVLARLLAKRGQDKLDERLGARLMEFIRNDDDLEAVWWVGPSDKEKYRYLLVTKDDARVLETNGPILAEISRAFIEKVDGWDICTEDQRP